MRVLCYCPTYRLEPETVDSIMRQTGVDDILDIHFSRWNPPHTGEKQVILWQYSRLQSDFKRLEYDYLWIVESDVIVPPDTLQRLLALDKDVANGAYMFRRRKPYKLNCCEWEPGAGYPMLSLTESPEELAKVWGEPVRASGVGIGCCLIKRHVLHGLWFRDGGSTHCDSTFAIDCLRNGYEWWVHLGIECGHKRPDGVIIWPTVDGYCETQGTINDDWHTEPARRACHAKQTM